MFHNYFTIYTPEHQIIRFCTDNVNIPRLFSDDFLSGSLELFNFLGLWFYYIVWSLMLCFYIY